MTIKKFFEVEDVGLRKYLYISGQVYSESTTKIVDNENKLGFYQILTSLKMNAQGAFYVDNKLSEYIVYKKEEKKVYLSKQRNTIYNWLLDYYFYSAPIICFLNIRCTPTLCKKIIEGSICTIGDFMAYLRSYVVRKKDLDILTINKFSSRLSLLNVVENPEEVQSIEHVQWPINHHIMSGNIFKFKIEDIGKQDERYAMWYSDQAAKAAMLKSGGFDQDGSNNGENTFAKTSDVPY